MQAGPAPDDETSGEFVGAYADKLPARQNATDKRQRARGATPAPDHREFLPLGEAVSAAQRRRRDADETRACNAGHTTPGGRTKPRVRLTRFTEAGREKAHSMNHEYRPLSCLRSAGRSRWSAPPRRCSCSTSRSSTPRCRGSPRTSMRASAAAVGRRRLHARACVGGPDLGLVADRFGRRRLFALGLAVFTAASSACAASTASASSMPPAPCRARRRNPVRHLARAARQRVPRRAGARRRAGHLRRHHRRLVRGRPARRRRADLGPGLAVGVPRQRAGRDILPLHHAAGPGVARSECASGRLGRVRAR